MTTTESADRATPAVEPDTLTPSQRERRERIIRAATALASRGGYDGVQMREIAEQADVALGTLYRYFPSKVHLLVAVMRAQTDRLRQSVEKNPGPQVGEASAADRVLHVLQRATRALERDPNLTGALLRALMFADPSVATDADAVSSNMASVITDAIGEQGDPRDREAIARVLVLVWHSSLLTWLNGRASSRQLYENLEVATRLLLPGED